MVAAVASAVALLVFFLPGDGGTDRAWAAPLVKVAESVPRLLVGEWQVTRADEFAVGQGEMDFTDGARTVQLSWRKGGDPIHKDGIIGWEQQGYALELRGEAAAEARAELRAVSIDEWLSAMPASVVRPVEGEQVVDQMVRDLPLPPGFDRSELDTGGCRATATNSARGWSARSPAAGSRPGSTASPRHAPKRSPPSRRRAAGPS